ncbi:HipA domain-containing protein [Primorskyibacter sedentarius]
MAMAMRTHCADALPQIHELYRRLVFTILLRNTDDHLRNHGFLRAVRGWVLSPAFDINPELHPGGWLQTPISEIHGAECSIRAALDAAPYFELSESEAREMVGAMARIIAAEWRPIGRELGMMPSDFSALATVMENEDLVWARSF